MAHQIEDAEIEEEVYDENADDDFNPDEAGVAENASSSEDEHEVKNSTVKTAGRKRKSEALDNDLDSGDEATINERQSKKRRRKGAGKAGAQSAPVGAEDDDDSAGEGGLIKTRAQRLAEKAERKHRRRAREGDVTIDVDSVWAQLAALPIGRQNGYVGVAKAADEEEQMNMDDEGNKENIKTAKVPPDNDELITVRRRIEYAGQVTEVEERVPRSSKEAQRYLAAHPEADQSASTPDAAPVQLRRPLKRPSLFEPNPHSIVKGVPPDRLRPRAPSRLDVLMAEKRETEAMEKKAQHMSTVEKSALDWRGFVAGQKGLREELDEYGKSKRGYLAREDFLGRVEFMRDVQAKAARLKG